MINICELYNDFKGQNNTWSKGHFRAKSFVFSVHQSSLEIFNELRKEWQKTNVISDALRPYFKNVQVSLKEFSLGGMIEYPKDYANFSSLNFFTKNGDLAGVICKDIPMLDKEKKCGRDLREEEKEKAQNLDTLIENPISKIVNNQWGSYCQHKFAGPSLDNPGCTEYKGGFKVLPVEIGIVVLNYLSIPQRPVLKAKFDDDHNLLCSDLVENGSLLWGEEILPDLMSRIKSKYAAYISNPQKWAEGQKESAANSLS